MESGDTRTKTGVVRYFDGKGGTGKNRDCRG